MCFFVWEASCQDLHISSYPKVTLKYYKVKSQVSHARHLTFLYLVGRNAVQNSGKL